MIPTVVRQKHFPALALVGIACEWLAACSPAPPRTRDIVVRSATLPVDNPEIQVVATTMPSGLTMDGNLAEWPQLAEATNRRGSGSSTVAFAITNERIVLAAQLGPAAGGGIWLGIASPAPELPRIGNATSHGDVQPLDCEHAQRMVEGEYVSTSTPNPPEVAAACRALVDRHADLKASLAHRFSRRIKIDASGVRSLNDQGTLTPLEGATITSIRSANGSAFEASLPLTAMPRVAEAPLSSLSVWATASPAPPPEVAPVGSAKSLPSPVSFEPNGSVRASVFQILGKPHQVDDLAFERAGISYQPGDPLHVETMHYADRAVAGGPPVRTSVHPVEELLYESKATLGDVEVGSLHALFEWVAIFHGGHLVESLALAGAWIPTRQLRDVVVRDGEIHVVSYSPGGLLFLSGKREPASWFVTAVAPDGSHREAVDSALERAIGKSGADCDAWSLEMKETSSSAFDTLGLGGTCMRYEERAGLEPSKGPRSFEVSWRWDVAKKMYVGKVSVRVPTGGRPPK